MNFLNENGKEATSSILWEATAHSMTHKLHISQYLIITSRPVRHFRLNKNSVTIILKLYTIFSIRRDYFHLQNIDIMVVLDN